MRAIDWGILAGFVVYAVVVGVRARRTASASLEQYFLAGRTLPGWKAGISMAATQFAADTPLLVTGLVATAGVFALWRLWIYALAFLLLGFVLAPGWRRAGVLTDAELAELRYSGRPAAALRGLKALYFGTVFNCTVLAMVLFAAKEIAEPFLIWDLWLPGAVFQPLQALVSGVGVPFIGALGSGDVWVRSTNNIISIGLLVAITGLYSTTGGLRSVVATDLLQFALMMAATLGYAVWVVHSIGGLGALEARLEVLFAEGRLAGMTPDQVLAFTPSVARDASFVVLFVFGLQWLVQMNADGTGYLAQRAMACRSDRDAKQAALVFVGLQVLLRSLLWLPLALGLLVLFPPDPSLAPDALRLDREVTFVRGMRELLPVGMVGLMLTAMLAALASTIDSHLNWGASYWTNDLYKRFLYQGWLGREPSARSLVWVARSSNVLILLIALAIMTQLDSIQVAWQVSLLLGAGMGVLLVLRWLWWRINAWGEIGAIAASLLLAPVLIIGLPHSQEALRLLLMALGSTGCGVALSLLTRPESDAVLDRFFGRVRPPGFWGGRGGRESVARLGRGLGAMTLAAFSVFSLLTGLGSWLIGSPAPSWFPYPTPWQIALVVLGLGVVPLWWRLGFARSEN